MLTILFTLINLISAQSPFSTVSFSDGFQPPPATDCELVVDPMFCWGPSVSTENVCIWDAADGLCSEESYEDMEVSCGMFMEPSSCNARTFCDYNDSDLKCEAHELTTETDYHDLHYLDCSSLSQAACNEYGGMGTECGWKALTGTCERGYAGNFDFFCMAFDAVKCVDVGTCMYDAAAGCVSRVMHPGGISTSYMPTLLKANDPHTSRLTKTIDYRFGAMVLIGLFIGVLIGSSSMYLCVKSSSNNAPVPLLTTPEQQVYENANPGETFPYSTSRSFV